MEKIIFCSFHKSEKNDVEYIEKTQFYIVLLKITKYYNTQFCTVFTKPQKL